MIRTAAILPDHHVWQGTGNVVSDMDGEKVMLSVKNGKYYNLGVMGGEIWELIKEPTTVNQVVSALVESYEVEQAACEEQVVSFLEALFAEGLIQVVAD